ncbi:hypothetical protein [Sporosarcina highlanderae]|uniref:Uncharacterized protein n=1 Tax=Sporosarcina highlanderae TaxID=3035916 RepID=A0ABT8JP52_9BACL|nr:hypothetical protein [Sporosarcina highlanderae]MDN4606925.1 hypothetical protein [Sporosarcina highlanderae]
MSESIHASIASLPYFTVERSIDWFQQKHQQSSNTLLLFEGSIKTKEHTFSLEHVHDVSYRAFSNGTGLFYLHTNRGVFTFEVKTDPNEFIHSYRKLKGDYYAF